MVKSTMKIARQIFMLTGRRMTSRRFLLLWMVDGKNASKRGMKVQSEIHGTVKRKNTIATGRSRSSLTLPVRRSTWR